MSIYSVDHTPGKKGRDAVLVDDTGSAKLKLNGAEVVLDARGKVGWYLRPPLVGSMFNGRIIDLRRMKNAAAGRRLHPATVHKEPLQQLFIVDVHEPRPEVARFGGPRRVLPERTRSRSHRCDGAVLRETSWSRS